MKYAALVLAAVAMMAMVLAGPAGAARPVPHRQSTSRCPTGYRVALKVVREDGDSKVFHACKKKAVRSRKSTIPTASVTDPTPAVSGTTAVPVDTTTTPTTSSGAPEVTTAPPASTPTPPEDPPTTPEPPSTNEEEGTTATPKVHAAIGPGFRQNPLVPNEVTWRYSATATQTVTVGGVAEEESVPLPEGELAFFVDGKLECEIKALGAIAGSACAVDLQALGEHEVETIYASTKGAISSTVTRTDFVDKYPTNTNLQVSVEPVAPEYLEIGPSAYGFIQYGFEVGRLRVTATTDPGGYPTFDCEGQSAGCLEPESPGLAAHYGSVSVPLFAQHRLNIVTGKEEWHVAFDAYNPTAREYGDFWQFPEESVGAQFFHAVSNPGPRLYDPSSVTVPLDLNGGHYPFYREVETGEGSSVAAVEGTMRQALVLGTYDKFDGPGAVLKFSGRFYGPTGEIEGCRYQPRVDGQGLGEHREPTGGSFEVLNGFYELPAGPHTFEIWAERAAGAGPGNCPITRGYLEAYEVMH